MRWELSRVASEPAHCLKPQIKPSIITLGARLAEQRLVAHLHLLLLTEDRHAGHPWWWPVGQLGYRSIVGNPDLNHCCMLAIWIQIGKLWGKNGLGLAF